LTPLYAADKVPRERRVRRRRPRSARVRAQKKRADVLLWIVTIAALLAALAAGARARRLSRRVDQLTQQYWELRYRFGELRARLDPDGQPADEPAAPPPPNQSFIPLSSLKR